MERDKAYWNNGAYGAVRCQIVAYVGEGKAVITARRGKLFEVPLSELTLADYSHEWG